MFNQSGECRPGWYVLAFRLVVITSSSYLLRQSIKVGSATRDVSTDPNARNRRDFLPQSLSQICRVVTLAFDRGKGIANRFRGCARNTPDSV